MIVRIVVALCGLCAAVAEEAMASSPVLLAMGRPGHQVLVATSSGALSALDLETGASLWEREVAVEGEWTMLRCEARLAVAGDTAGTVRAWEAGSGEPAWHHGGLGRVLNLFLPAGPRDSAGRQGHIIGGEDLLMALTPDGHPWWSAPAKSSDGQRAKISKWRGAAMHEDGSTVCVLAEEADKDAGGEGFSVFRFAVDSGKILSRVPLPAEAASAAVQGHVLVAGTTLAYIAEDKLGVHPLCGDSSGQFGEPEAFDLKAVRLRPPGSNWLTPWMQTHGLFGGTNGHFTFIFKAGPTVVEGLKLAWINNAVGASGPVHAGDEDGLALVGRIVTAVPRKDLYEIRVTSIDGSTQEPFSVPRDYSGRGEMRLVVGKELSSSERRWVLSAADGSLAAVSDADSFLWVRESGTIGQSKRKEL